MVSISHHGSSSSSTRWSIDVFLSFQGEDTRKTFVDYLHMMLEQAGINVFIDDVGLRKGEDISSELVKAIQTSKISIVVFSRNYADSTWCLEELSTIMHCRRTLQQMVIPIFFDIKPADVRIQKGSFAEALEKHERRFLSLGNDTNKIQTWKDDLTEAADISGCDLRNTADGHHAKLIKKIVEQVSRELNNSCLFVTLYPVGIQSRLEDLCDMLCVGHNDVYMLGITGMGGIGKTTIAKAIYNQLNYSFEDKSFLMNVREKNLVSLQEQLLFDILKIKVEVGCEDRGINVMRQRLCSRRVLIIVDDVDHSNQLNSLVGSCKWFGPGSRILITTRDKRLLDVHGVNNIYMAKEMDDTESHELFSWHAFRKSSPHESYHELSKCMVGYCSGLPIALEVVGRSLFNRSIIEWRSMLDKMKKIPPNEVQEKLRISYDTLDDEVKNIFLDICCFFIDMPKNYVVQILDGCGFSTEIAVSLLLDRCLITVNYENKFVVHNLLQEMASRVIREKFPLEPGKWSRLWHQEDVLDVLEKHTGSEEIKGLTLRIEKACEAWFHTGTFSKMQRLRLLQLDYVQLNGSYENVSKELRWLCWHGFPKKVIPNSFNLENVVAMDLQYSNLRQLWKNAKSLEKLKILNVSHSHYLIRTPDFSEVPNLNELILEGCTSLSEVHHSIGKLHKLVLVNLRDCKALKRLPRSFYHLNSVEVIILSGCSTFHDLDEGIGKMESLTTLFADNTRIKSLPSTIQQLSKLEMLYLSCGKVSTPKSWPSLFRSWVMGTQESKPTPSLLASLHGLNFLKDLRLRSCNLTDDDVNHTGVWNLPFLLFLDLSSNNFQSLASNLSGLSQLVSLTLDNNEELQSIPNLPITLATLRTSNCIALEALPNLSENKQLVHLILRGCRKLAKMPDLDKFLMSTPAIFDIQGCHNINASFSESTRQRLSTIDGVSLYVHGDDIPEWFPYVNQSSGECIGVSFEVPQLVGLHVEGLLVSIAYIASNNFPTFRLNNPNGICVVNFTKRKIHIIPSEKLGLHYLKMGKSGLCQCHILSPTFGLSGGDEVIVLSCFGGNIICKKIAACLVWNKPINSNLLRHMARAHDNAIWRRLDRASFECEINFPCICKPMEHLERPGFNMRALDRETTYYSSNIDFMAFWLDNIRSYLRDT